MGVKDCAVVLSKPVRLLACSKQGIALVSDKQDLFVVRVKDWKYLAKGTSYPKVDCSDGSDDLAAVVLKDGTLKLVDLLETSYAEKNERLPSLRLIFDCKWSSLLDSRSNLVSVRLQKTFLCASFDDKCLRTWPLTHLLATMNSKASK